MSGYEDLLRRARECAESEVSLIPAPWGYRIVLDEDESFVGRWRGETTDPLNVDDKGKPRRIFLLWDAEGQRCFSRHYAALGREINRTRPQIGDTIVIYRGADYAGQEGPGYSFGVETAANGAPLPADDVGF
jgi:hypothetical protein